MFNELKPKIENLVSIQRQLANGFIRCKKKLIAQEILKRRIPIVKSLQSFTKNKALLNF
jgi:preprotein translocase subunit SecA